MTAAIVLASTSPRRRDFLKDLGLDFLALSPDIEEVPLPGEAPAAYVARNACLKAEVVTKRPELQGSHDLVVIAADTIVVLDEAILEKPRDAADACAMLGRLSGRVHTVLTAIHVLHRHHGTFKATAEVVASKVLIKSLSAKEIADYVATGEPMDKAGSYAVQGKGSYMVQEIQGSYTNVVGLPLTEVVTILNRCGIFLFQNGGQAR